MIPYSAGELVRWCKRNWANATIAEIEARFDMPFEKALFVMRGFRKAGYDIPERVRKNHPTRRNLKKHAEYLQAHYAAAPIENLIKGLKVKTKEDVFNIASKCRESGYKIPFRNATKLEIDPITRAAYFDDREKRVGAVRKPVLSDAIDVLRKEVIDLLTELYGE